MVELTREEYNLIAKGRGIIKPQNMPTKLINIKNRTRKIAKIPNISENEVNQAEKLQKKSQ